MTARPWRPALNAARAAALALLRPPARQRLSTWAESAIRLPADLASTPGPMNLWAFQRDMLDAMVDPRIERVTIQKGARLGFTSLLAAVVAHHAVNDPQPVLAVLPVELDARNFVIACESIFTASPALRGALAVDRSADSRDTLLYRRWPGGSLRVVPAKSPRSLRSHAARVLLIDEADAMETSTEGSPIKLAEARTMSFAPRKIVVGSTPTTTTTSHVVPAYVASDQRIYECPCPSCGAFHEIAWRNIQWPEGKPQDAAWCCPSCGVLHGEARKPGMVAAGRWRITAPHVEGHAGFKLNCLIAPHPAAAWPKLAAEFLAAKRSADLLKPFLATVLGEPWDDADAEGALDPGALARLVQPIGLDRIPPGVRFITCGVDVQRSWLAAVVVGFDADDGWHVLHAADLHGDPLRPEVWHDLHDFIAQRWPHPLGGEIGIDRVAVDAGDGLTSEMALGFAAAHRSRGVVAIKGDDGASRPAIQRSTNRAARGLHIVGVDPIKGRIFDRITAGSGLALSDALPPAWHEELLSERRVVRYLRGKPVQRWERLPGRRSEGLDGLTYAVAARHLVSTSPSRRQDELTGHAPPPALPSVIKSRWISGG